MLFQVNPVYGPIPGFPSGSWWGIRMDCSRDRVHIPFNKDIEEGRYGVASICTCHLNDTNDVDHGLFLTYTGGKYISGKSSDPLIKNLQNQIPLRLLRSYDLSNKFAPKTGYRYDGLYIVTSTWIASDGPENYYKYALARLNCQEPPPWLAPCRTSTRLSTAVRKNNSKTGCGSVRCHMYGCGTNGPEKPKKNKITLERSPPANKSVSKSSDSTRKNAHDSTIVMRHVSKKTDAIHHAESPVASTNHVLPRSPKPPTFKLQNTNISIRTELYDSSPNHQQEPKKSTPMTFCRTYKSNRAPATINNMNVTMNLNGPTEDKVHESQIQSRTRLAKISQSPTINSNATKVKDNCSIKSSNSTPNNVDALRKNLTPQPSSAANYSEFTNTESKDRAENLNNKNINRTVNLPDSPSRSSSTASFSSTDSLLKKLHLPEAVVSLESMTPEQMLSLIVKKRYKATGKLLIGSIIGLPVEDPYQMNLNNVNTPNQPTNEDNTVHSNSTAASPITEIKTPKKTINKPTFYQSRSKSAPMSKIRNENKERGIKSMRLKRTRVPRALAELEGSNINRTRGATKLLNKTHSSDKIVQPFSKSTTPKKRRGELANLAIDANFVTNIRGHMIQTRTMSRQLRGPTIILSKRKEFSGFITNYTRFDLSKKNKRLAATNKTRIPKNRHVQNKKKTNDNNKTTTRSGNKEDKNKNSNCRPEKPLKINETRKPGRPKSQMIDAMTQCTPLKDAATSVDSDIQTQAPIKSVKIELIDLTDDVKSELGESDTESLQEIIYQDCEVQTTNEQPNFTENINDEDGMSAFVPVNLSEGDFRVARLRSIGFKPIEPCAVIADVNDMQFNNFSGNDSAKSTVAKRDVGEQYNKYTSEENNVVGYMDNELHYQDIEAEETPTRKITGIICKHQYTKRKIITGKYGQPLIRKRKYSSSSCDDDEEEDVPWPGWETVRTNR